MSRVKLAEVRFYLDADILGLARVFVPLRPDFTYPGDPGAVIHKRERSPCPVTSPYAKDEEWIPTVTRHGWLIVTRDRHIRDHRREIAAVREYGARMVALASADARSVFAQLEVVMCQWRAIERLLDERDRSYTPPPGPLSTPCGSTDSSESIVRSTTAQIRLVTYRTRGAHPQ